MALWMVFSNLVFGLDSEVAGACKRGGGVAKVSKTCLGPKSLGEPESDHLVVVGKLFGDDAASDSCR